jgi:hypothetical protein
VYGGTSTITYRSCLLVIDGDDPEGKGCQRSYGIGRRLVVLKKRRLRDGEISFGLSLISCRF